MNEKEKPIHVRVAEALGTGRLIFGGEDRTPRYDTDWAATGPLIEKLKINLSWNGEHWFSHVPNDIMGQSCLHIGEGCGFAPCADRDETPLGSVCKTILVLSEAGELKELL